MGRATDPVAFFEALAEAPYRFDFYQTLRRLECLYDDQPRWGEALRPGQERVRLGQDPDLSFAPASLASFDQGREGRLPRLQVRLFGLFGPNGPLPLHITEYARERLRNAGDATLCRFLDLFHHRLLALFYRAWAQAQPHVNRDRPDRDRFSAYIGALVGLSPDAFRERDRVPDVAKFFHVGSLVRHVRNADGLAAVVQHFFRVPAAIQEFVGHWMALGPRERTYLAREGATLGTAAVLGRAVWDRQHKFRIRLGPLTLQEYESFLPGALVSPELQSSGAPVSPKLRSSGAPVSPKLRSSGAPVSPKLRSSEGGRTPLEQLVDWVRLYDGLEREWDVRLRLAAAEVPRLRLGAGARLGWTTWLGTRRSAGDAEDLCLRAESFVAPAGVMAA